MPVDLNEVDNSIHGGSRPLRAPVVEGKRQIRRRADEDTCVKALTGGPRTRRHLGLLRHPLMMRAALVSTNLTISKTKVFDQGLYFPTGTIISATEYIKMVIKEVF